MWSPASTTLSRYRLTAVVLLASLTSVAGADAGAMVMEGAKPDLPAAVVDSVPPKPRPLRKAPAPHFEEATASERARAALDLKHSQLGFPPPSLEELERQYAARRQRAAERLAARKALVAERLARLEQRRQAAKGSAATGTPTSARQRRMDRQRVRVRLKAAREKEKANARYAAARERRAADREKRLAKQAADRERNALKREAERRRAERKRSRLLARQAEKSQPDTRKEKPARNERVAKREAQPRRPKNSVSAPATTSRRVRNKEVTVSNRARKRAARLAARAENRQHKADRRAAREAKENAAAQTAAERRLAERQEQAERDQRAAARKAKAEEATRIAAAAQAERKRKMIREQPAKRPNKPAASTNQTVKTTPTPTPTPTSTPTPTNTREAARQQRLAVKDQRNRDRLAKRAAKKEALALARSDRQAAKTQKRTERLAAKDARKVTRLAARNARRLAKAQRKADREANRRSLREQRLARKLARRQARAAARAARKAARLARRAERRARRAARREARRLRRLKRPPPYWTVEPSVVLGLPVRSGGGADERSLEALTAQALVGYHWASSGFSVRGGITATVVSSKVSSERTTTGTISVGGVAVPQTTVTTTKYYNQLSSVDFPLLAGYRLRDSKYSLLIEAGPSLNLSSGGDGHRRSGEGFVAIPGGEYLGRRPGIGFLLQLTGEYRLSDRAVLTGGLRVQSFGGAFEDPQVTGVRTSVTTIGLQLGYRVRF